MSYDPFIGEINMFAGTFAPRGWALCNGQLLDISQNSALFSILGTTYGGDGIRTFALPDLRGRFPVHAGTGPGLSNRTLGRPAGEESVTLTADQIPSHSHKIACTLDHGNTDNPTDRFPAATIDTRADGKPIKGYHETPKGEMNAGVVKPTGGSAAHDNMPPHLPINFIIALTGIFPSRS